MGDSRIRLVVTVSLFLTAIAGDVLAAPVVKSFSQILTRPAGDPGTSTYGATLDINDDSIPDVSILHATFMQAGTNVANSQNVIGGVNGATILTDGTFPLALHPGEVVDPAGTYSSSILHILDTVPLGSQSGNAEFFNDDVAIGVRIPVGGQNVYAWIGVQLAGAVAGNPFSDRLILHGYGYEATPDTAVAAEAPEPASLALIGLATVPLLVRRRR